jgi:acetyltransferase EpsM
MVEDIVDHDQSWFSQHQFHSSCSNIAFKKFVIDQLQHKNPHWISVIGAENLLYDNVSIGHNTFINYYNFLQESVSIGNHCTITTHAVISHEAKLKDFCHVSAYTMINHAVLEDGICAATRATVIGRPDNILYIEKYCNLMLGSIITKSILISGTYFGNRRVSDKTSLTYKIL